MYHFSIYCANPSMGRLYDEFIPFDSPCEANPGQTTQIMDIFVIAFSALAVLLAAIIRGPSGFGFSMVATTSMTLVLPPVEVIPVGLVLEILASAWLPPRVCKQILFYFSSPAGVAVSRVSINAYLLGTDSLA